MPVPIVLLLRGSWASFRLPQANSDIASMVKTERDTALTGVQATIDTTALLPSLADNAGKYAPDDLPCSGAAEKWRAGDKLSRSGKQTRGVKTL